MIKILILCWLAVWVAGCEVLPKLGPLVIRAEEGAAIATGELRLPAPLPTVGAFDGTFKLRPPMFTKEFPWNSISSGQCRGSVRGGEITIDLNPNVPDNTVLLVGKRTGDMLQGTWRHNTVAGSKAMGEFTLTLTRK